MRGIIRRLLAPTASLSSSAVLRCVAALLLFSTFSPASFAQFTSIVTIAVPGGGTVISAATGIRCTAANSPCNYAMPALAGETLQAVAQPGFTFASWSTSLGNSTANPLVVQIPFGSFGAAANFMPISLQTITITKSGHGSGTVDSNPPIAGCGATCSASFFIGTTITLRATPSPGSVFGGWMGACTGHAPTCTVTLAAAAAADVTAIFLPKGVASTISVGDAHACAVTSAGQAQCWGAGLYGRLGNGSSSNSAFPVPVTGLSSAAVSVVAGTYHSCALTNAGAVQCWGGNGWGQLGVGGIQDRLAPVQVNGLSGGMVAVAAGGIHSCALSSTGAVKCWGNNRAGQLGDGSIYNGPVSNPVSVAGLPGGVMALGAGVDHTCALTTSGGVHCWGTNVAGELGNATNTASPTPVAVSGLSSGVVAIASGSNHTCALTNAGTVKCWGRNARVDPPGSNNLVNTSTPVTVEGLTGTVIALGAGAYHTCAVKTGGAVQCWGENGSGELGNGLGVWSPTPVSVVGFEAGAVAVGAGWNSTCAITEVGAARCWGANYVGQLGNGSNVGSRTPVPVSGLGSAIAVLNGGCGVTNAGSLACWNQGMATPTESPGRAQNVVSASSAGNDCTINGAGGLSCSGFNLYGQLGNGTSVDSVTPVPVTGLGANVASAGVGYLHACALTDAGAVQCWGYNGSLQLGNPLSGSVVASNVPVPVTGLASGAAALSTGYAHNCVITTAGGISCWGMNVNRELGSGTSVTGSVTPLPVVGLAAMKAVSAGSQHTCALSNAGAVSCWGNGFYGQIGNGANATAATPAAVTGLGSGVAAIAAGSMHSCALTNAGAVKCWGNNVNGELGNGGTANSNVPVAVTGLDKGVIAISSSWSTRTCALLGDGTVRCWGTLVNPSVARSPVRTGNLPRTSALAFTAPAGVPSLVPSGQAGSNFTLAASATSTLAVSFSSITPTHCSVAGNVAALLAPGVCVVQAKQPGDATFDPSPTQGRMIAVTPMPTYLLTVTRAGNGSGVVTSLPAGIDCGATCAVPFAPSTTIVLTAVPAAGSIHSSWSGCDSVNGAQCTVTMNAVRGPIATFRLPSVRGDVNGDRKADLFWREAPPATGVSWWTMNGSTATATNYYQVSADWQIADVGDLNGDGKADIIWRRTTDGATYLWVLDGLVSVGSFDLGTLDPAVWTLVGAADFNGDGKSDLAWRSNTGAFYFWLMDGGVIASQGGTAPLGAEWQVIDLADMSGDGKADIVFRNTNTGEVYVWFMNGIAIGSQSSAGTLDPALWTLLAVADFNGDRKADFLWREVASGNPWVWIMDGASYVSGGVLAANPGADWSVKSVADFDGDGKADLIWRHTDGTTYFWKVDGISVPSYGPVSNPGGSWQIVAP